MNVYKYPRGLYSPNSSNVWELVPFNVKLAEDSLTLVNITNWTEWISFAFDINIGDLLIYNSFKYINLTGSQTALSPDVDTTNWRKDIIEGIIRVAKSGGDFTAIKSAIDSITDNSSTIRYNIIVAPGVYTEDNPIQGKSYVNITSAGLHSVRITAGNPNQDLFISANLFYIVGCSLVGVTGITNYAVNHSVLGEAVVKDCVITDCSNGILLNNANGFLNLIDCAIYTPVSSTVRGIYVQAGNLTIDFLKVVLDATITTILEADGSNCIITLNNLLSFSANITTALKFINGARTSGASNNIVLAYDGVVVYGNNTQTRLSSLNVFNCQNDGIRVENTGTGINTVLQSTTISGSTGYNINILNPNSVSAGDGFSEIDNINIVDNAQLWASILDTIEGDEGINIFGELKVGTSMRPAETVMGAGDSHTFEYVYTEDSSNVFTDVTTAARSFSGSTFQFDGVDINSSIYICNRFPITFEGIKILITTEAVMGAGSIIIEYWNGAWTEFNGCTSLSSPGFLKYAKEYFERNGSYHIKFNPFIIDDWIKNDPITPSIGEDLYWVRFRIVSAITTSPTIQQIKIHTNRAEFNIDGTYESHGDGRTYKKLVVDAVRPLEGNMQNSSIYVDENVGVGLENNRFTTTGDLLGISFELPEDCDTSAPLIFVWKGKFASTGTVEFTIRIKIVRPGDAYTNSEPAASGDTVTILTGSIVISSADVREDLRLNLDISEAIPSRTAGFGDEIWITLQYSTRGAGNFDYTKLSANYLSDFNGRHIRQ